MLNLMSKEELANIPVAILPYDYVPGNASGRGREWESGGSAGLTGRREDGGTGRDKGASCHSCDAYRPEPQLSGNLMQDPEIVLPGPYPIQLSYFYNAASTQTGPYGYGRTMSPHLTAQASGSPLLVTLTRGD